MKRSLAILLIASTARADFYCDPKPPLIDRFRASPLVVEGAEARPLRYRRVLVYGPDWLALGTATLGEIGVHSSFKGSSSSRLLVSTPSWRDDVPVIDCAPEAMGDWTQGDHRILFLDRALGVPRTFACDQSPLLSERIGDLGPIASLFGSDGRGLGSEFPWKAARTAGELLGALGQRRIPSRSAPSTARFIWRSGTEVLVDLRSASNLLERQSPFSASLSHQERAERALSALFPDFRIVQLRLGTGSHGPDRVKPLLELLKSILRTRREEQGRKSDAGNTLHILLGTVDTQPVPIPPPDDGSESLHPGGPTRCDSWMGTLP